MTKSPESGSSFAPHKPTLIVGIGASAGGVDAVRKFFSRLTVGNDVAFVFLQHLDDSGRQLAHDVLSHRSPLPVREAQDGEAIRSGIFYHAPPRTAVMLKDGTFVLERSDRREDRFALIDVFFRSLAEDQGQRAVGIVLSGDGTDGAHGLKAINDAGGMTLVQMPESAEFPSMPQHAVNAGVADHIVTPEEMPAELAIYARYLEHLLEDGNAIGLYREIIAALVEICEILHKVTRHDFKHYKTSTLVRRIQRRMQVLQLSDAGSYVDRLRGDAKEAENLFKELLINVTSFFRDPEAFETLKHEVLAKALLGRKPEHKFRVWVAGCSTGEEVYTLAILVRELLADVEKPPEIQIIATDIDETALNQARKGSYPVTIAENVSPERLSRFFVRKAGRYHVAKELREIVLFSSHNLINDPPFSQLDLISCRNVLIYLGAHLQKKLIPVFHYALKPNGSLFLGTSESLATHKELFRTVSAKHRIAQRKATAIRPPGFTSPIAQTAAHPVGEGGQSHDADLLLVGQRIILDEFAPRYAIVNDEAQIVSVSAGIGQYLEPSAGSFQNSILKLVKPSLRVSLRAAFAESKKLKRKISNEDSTLKVNETLQRTGLTVQPMPQLGDEAGLFMVVFQYLGVVPAREGKTGKQRRVGRNAAPTSPADESAVIEQLERELTALRVDLDRSVQDLEASNEELKSSNEELLSMNEELQSANEELEASKEEVQDANEALQRGNTDLENLLASTEIATLFLDKTLRIANYTPALESVYNVTRADVGRPISHFTHGARSMPELPSPEDVTRRKELVEEHVEMTDGRWLLRRIAPYRTSEGLFSGIVVTFIDVTHLRSAEDRYRDLANTMPSVIWTARPDGTIDYVNDRWCQLAGVERDTPNAMSWHRLVHPDDAKRHADAWRHATQAGEPYATEFRLRDAQSGEYFWFTARAEPVHDAAGRVKKWYGSCINIHDRVLAEAARRESESRFRIMADSAPVLVWISDAQMQRYWFNRGWLNFTGRTPEQEHGEGWVANVHPDDLDRYMKVYRESFAARREFHLEYRLRHHSGGYRWIGANSVPRFAPDGTFEGFVGACLDIHSQKTAVMALEENEMLLDTMFKTSPSFMCLLTGDDFVFEKANERYMDLVGRRDIIGKPLAVALPEIAGLGFVELMRRVAATGEPYLGSEVRLMLNRGPRQEPEEVFVDFVYQADGAEGRRIFVHGFDVTAKVRARKAIEDAKALIENERENFRSLYRQTPEMVCVLSGPEHRFEFVNQAHVKVLGFDATGMTVREAQPESVEVHGILDEVYRTGVTAELHEIPVTLGDRLRYFNLTYSARRSPDGSPDGVMIMGTEITEQLLMRETLDSQRQALELALTGESTEGVLDVLTRMVEQHTKGRSLASALLVTDDGRHLRHASAPSLPDAYSAAVDGVEIAANAGSCGTAAFLGTTVMVEDIGTDPLWSDYRDVALAHGLRACWSTPILASSGKVLGTFALYYKERRQPTADERQLVELVTRTAAVVIERRLALNDLKRAHDEAERARESAEAASQAKTRFLANMSHEIRTPLGAIVGFSSLLSGAAPAEGEINSFVDSIARNAAQLSRLIDELLDLSKIEANKLEIERVPTDLHAVVADTFSAFAGQIQSKGLVLEERRLTDLPTTVMTDPTRLRQILFNLIGNAVKFTEAGKIVVELRVTDEAGARRLEVRVADTGIGMTAEQRQKIFEPFTQADNSITRKYGGTGLGLTLSRDLARLLGGDIVLAATAQGVGSTFVLSIDLGAPLKESVQAEDGAIPAAMRSLTGKRILIVDDAADNRFLVGRFVQAAGAEHETAADGQDALERIAATPFDLVLMDLQMPRLDGYQAVVKLRADGYAMPVVALTAHALKEERRRCLEAGFDDYVTKPINPRTLLRVISDLIARGRGLNPG